jgi:NAD(P)H-flavin reductase
VEETQDPKADQRVRQVTSLMKNHIKTEDRTVVSADPEDELQEVRPKLPNRRV